MLDKNGQKFIKDQVEEAVGQIIQATNKGFEGVDKRFDKVEVRLEKVEGGLSFVRDSVNNLKSDTPTAKEFQNHERRITSLEKVAFA